MLNVNPLDLFVAWTPVSVAALLVFGLMVIAAAVLLYVNRAAASTWFNARWIEQSSAHARTIAIWTTGYYIASRIGIPDITPVSLNLCLIGWVRAAWKFIKPDGGAPTQSVNGGVVVSLALCMIFAVGLSGCTAIQGLTGDPSKDLPAIGSNITAADASAQKSIAAISKFTVTDLQDADADALANSDTAAHSCYQALIPVVQSRANAAAPAVGAISAFQRTRDLVKLVKGQGSNAQACAALKQDVTGDVLGLGSLFGVP